MPKLDRYDLVNLFLDFVVPAIENVEMPDVELDAPDPNTKEFDFFIDSVILRIILPRIVETLQDQYKLEGFREYVASYFVEADND